MTQINYHKALEREKRKTLPERKAITKKPEIRFVKRNGEWIVDIPKNLKEWIIKAGHTVYVRRRGDGKLIHVRLKECVNENEYATHWTFTRGNGRMGPSQQA